MLARHFSLLGDQLGIRRKVGDATYRMRGYAANRMARDFRHEPHLLPILARILKQRPGAFVDVGVNTGQTFLKVLALDSPRQYVGFEPLVPCAFFVQQFIRDNGIDNASILAVALSDSDSLQQFHFTDGYDEMASLENDGKPGHMWVQTRTADAVFREIGLSDIAMIKIDVEGAEWRVLSGMRDTLSKHRPVLLFEQLPNFEGHNRLRISEDRARRNSASAATVWGILAEAGYRVLQIDEEGREYDIAHFDLDDTVNYHGRDFLALPV